MFLLRKRLSIRTRITVLCLLIGAASVATVGWLSFRHSSDMLLAERQAALGAVRASTKLRLEDYFGFIREQVRHFAQDRMISEATVGFTAAFHKLPEEVAERVEPGTEAHGALTAYYENEYGKRLRDAGLPWSGASAYIPQLPAARLAQWMYIANNEHPVGSKLDLDASSVPCDYNRLHATYHPLIRGFLQSFGYYDIFLFDTEGNLVYSVFKETDYGTNFVAGPYKDTNFARVVRAALASSEPGSVHLVDFEPYTPSYGAAASFVGSPVFRDGRKVGAAVYQMPVANINRIVTAAEGLGETGHNYVVGPDALMRSAYRFNDAAIFTEKADTDAARRALAGESGDMTQASHRGGEALAAFAPLAIEGLQWGLVTEMSTSEVTAPARALGWRIAGIGAALAAAVAVVSVLFAAALVRPIKLLEGRMREIAEGDGDLTQRVDESRTDELGALGRSFNRFVANVHDILAEVVSASQHVAGAAGDIAQSCRGMVAGMGQQDAQVQSIAAAMEEMSSSIAQSASKAGDASAAAKTSQEQAAQGERVVERTIADMGTIRDAVTETSRSVQELGKRSGQIGQIVQVINDIADQTNLLALNAAIEAARAGEHGRGFAVVADEVRKLADRTTKATGEIASSIKAIQSETEDAVARMDRGTERVSEGARSATEAGESLRGIVGSAREVSSLIAGIAAAAAEQSDAAENIAGSVASIASIARDTNAGAKGTAEAVAQLAERSTEVQSMLRRFKLAARGGASDADNQRYAKAANARRRVLVADDDAASQFLLKRMLEKWADVETAGGGKDALLKIEAAAADPAMRFDLVCLDIRMPDMDGQQVLRELRAVEARLGVPEAWRTKVAMVTAVDEPGDRLASLSQQAMAYIRKPIDEAQVRRMIEALGWERTKAA